MNKFRTLLIITCAFAATSALAGPLFQNHSGGQIINRIYVTTPGDKRVALDFYQLFDGSSKTSPCSDLALVEQEGGHGDFVQTGVWPLTAETAFNSFGPAKTCFLVKYFINGKFYTSGNVQLIWDSKSLQYTGTHPSSEKIDIIE